MKTKIILIILIISISCAIAVRLGIQWGAKKTTNEFVYAIARLQGSDNPQIVENFTLQKNLNNDIIIRYNYKSALIAGAGDNTKQNKLKK